MEEGNPPLEEGIQRAAWVQIWSGWFEGSIIVPPAMEPCFLESFQWCWNAICACGVSSLLSLCRWFETDVLILDDCTSTSCCVQSWSTLPALPADFYLKPAEELRHLLWKWGGGKGKKEKPPKSDSNSGRPVSRDSLHWWREVDLFFWKLLWKLQALREAAGKTGCLMEPQWLEEHWSWFAELSSWLCCEASFTSITTGQGFKEGLKLCGCSQRAPHRWQSEVEKEMLSQDTAFFSSCGFENKGTSHESCEAKADSCPAMQKGPVVWETEELDLLISRITRKGWMSPLFVSMRSLMKWE